MLDGDSLKAVHNESLLKGLSQNASEADRNFPMTMATQKEFLSQTLHGFLSG
jgi:hypothetical protein